MSRRRAGWAACVGLGILTMSGGRAAESPAGAEPTRIRIESQAAEVEPSNNRATFTGRVKVVDQDTELTCDSLTVLRSAETGAIVRVDAEGNVVIVNEAEQSRATGQKAVYLAETNTMELTGDPVFDSPQYHVVGDVLILDRNTGSFKGRNVRMELILKSGEKDRIFAPRPAPATP